MGKRTGRMVEIDGNLVDADEVICVLRMDIGPLWRVHVGLRGGAGFFVERRNVKDVCARLGIEAGRPETFIKEENAQ